VLAGTATIFKAALAVSRAIGVATVYSIFTFGTMFNDAINRKKIKCFQTISETSSHSSKSVFEKFFFQHEFYLYLCILIIFILIIIFSLIVLWGATSLYSTNLKNFIEKYKLVKLQNLVNYIKKISFLQIVCMICLFYCTVFLCIYILLKNFNIF